MPFLRQGNSDKWMFRLIWRAVTVLCLLLPSLAGAQRWEFASSTEGWTGRNGVISYGPDGPRTNLYLILSSGTDPGVVSPGLSLDASSNPIVKFYMSSNLSDLGGKLYWKTSTQPSYSESMMVPFAVCGTGPWCAYQISMSGHANWSGVITGIRIDPGGSGGSGQVVGFDYIETASPATLAPPALRSPVAGVGVAGPPFVFTWDPITGAGAYQIKVSTDPAFVTTIVEDHGLAGSANSFSWPGSLAAGTSHYWQMRTLNSTGTTWGAWSAVERFVPMAADQPQGSLAVSATAGSVIYHPAPADYEYRYGPAIILSGDTFDMWAAAPGPGLPMDVIQHRRGVVSGTGSVRWLTAWTNAINATPGSEDQCSTCDPSVIFFRGYYYIGYTSTKSCAGGGKSGNQVFVARCSALPDGSTTCAKWNGAGWGGNPQPIITSAGTGWGKGQPSFVVKDNQLYLYYTDNGTKVVTVDATAANWPALINEGQAVTILQNEVDTPVLGGKPGPFEVKYIDAYGKFIGVGVSGEFGSASNVFVYESDDGLTFTPVIVNRGSWGDAPIQVLAHNIGISGDATGHLDPLARNFIAYGFGLPASIIDTDGFKARWPTYLNPITVTSTAAAPPVVSGTTPTNLPTPEWSWVSGGGGVGTFRYKLDDSDLSTGARETTETVHNQLEAVPEGPHTLYVQEQDATGRWSASGSFTITVDLSAPTTALVAKPANPSKESTPTFTFNSDDENAAFECSLDLAGFAACDQTHQLFDLTEGAHTLTVRARDLAGNIDPNPAIYPWRVDTTPPSLDSLAPTPITSEQGLAQTVTAVYGERGGAANLKSVEILIRRLPGGSNAIWAQYDKQSRRLALRTDSGARSQALTCAPGAVGTIIANSQGGLDCGRTQVSSAGDTLTVAWSIIPAMGFASETVPKRIFLRATDRAMNTTGWVDKGQWTITPLPPIDTHISGQPAEQSRQTTAIFHFSSNDPGATFQCRRDAAPFAACASPKVLTGLGEGQHTFAVRAMRQSGVVDSTPASVTWTVDRTPPDTAIEPIPNFPSGQTLATFSFTSPEAGVTFQCKLDGAGSFTFCPSPKTFKNLAAGGHTFSVRARDRAGNVDLTPSVFTWLIDHAPAP